MSMLHLVNKSPYENNNLSTASSTMRSGDVLLLIEDAVYAAVKGGKASSNAGGAQGIRSGSRPGSPRYC